MVRGRRRIATSSSNGLATLRSKSPSPNARQHHLVPPSLSRARMGDPLTALSETDAFCTSQARCTLEIYAGHPASPPELNVGLSGCVLLSDAKPARRLIPTS